MATLVNEPRRAHTRLETWLPTALLFVGAAVFLGAGRLHPKINSSIGAIGSVQFFRNFAAHMLHTPHWQQMHFLILAGPVLWALASAGIVRILPERAKPIAEVARHALLLGAALWAVAFVLDGSLGPRYAIAVIASN